MAIRSRVDSAVQIVDELASLMDVREIKNIAEQSFALEVKKIQTPLINTLQQYPPPLPNQKYRRTFKLKRSWRLRLPTKLQWVIESVGVNYQKWVVGTFDARTPGKFQARIHRNRWKLAYPKVRHFQNQFIENFGNRFNRTFEDIAVAIIRKQNR